MVATLLWLRLDYKQSSTLNNSKIVDSFKTVKRFTFELEPYPFDSWA